MKHLKKIKYQYLLALLCLLCSLSACHRVKPQAAANQSTVDSVAINAALLNMRLAEQANNACVAYVQQQDTAFVLADFGLWYSVTHRSGGRKIKLDDTVELFYDSQTLDGQMLENAQIQVKQGQRETMFAIEFLLPNIAEGDEVTVVTPYYIAYGREGNEHVPPLTNCVLHLRNIKIIE